MHYFNKYLFPILLLLISGLILFWQFPFIPQKLAFDGLEFTRLALSLEKHPTLFSPYATGHATPYFFLLLVSFKIFGLSVFALRLPAALFALGSVWLCYLLLCKFTEKRQMAFLGALSFASLHWFFNFGRFAFEGTYLLFWELVAFYNIFLFTTTKKDRNFNIGLLATVLTFYSYLPGRIFCALPLLMLFMYGRQKKNYRPLIDFAASLVFWLSPLIFITSGGEERVGSLTFLSANSPILHKIGFLLENVWKNIYMLFGAGDLNGRHNYPGKSALNPLLVGLLILGLWNFKKSKYSFYVVIFWGLSVLPSLFTYPTENPHFLRTLSSVFSLIFFITLGIGFIWYLRIKFLRVSLVVLLMLSIFYELRTYYHYQVPVFSKAFEIKKQELLKLQKIYGFKTIWNR